MATKKAPLQIESQCLDEKIVWTDDLELKLEEAKKTLRTVGGIAKKIGIERSVLLSRKNRDILEKIESAIEENAEIVEDECVMILRKDLRSDDAKVRQGAARILLEAKKSKKSVTLAISESLYG